MAWTHNFTRIAAVVTSAGAATACLFNPDYEADNCELRCTRSCLPGFVCRDGYCVTPDFGGSCSEPPVTPQLQVLRDSGVHASDADVAPDAAEDAMVASLVDAASDAGRSEANAEAASAESGAQTDPGRPKLAIASPTRLPEACAGQRYEYRLEATGGAGYYSWNTVGTGSAPSWLTLESSGELSGLAPTDAEGLQTVTVRVASAASDSPVRREFELPVLRSCKFGFIGNLNNRARLMVGDVRRGVQASQFESVDVTANLSAELDVHSFEFAPSGQALVFTVGADGGGVAESLWVAAVTDIAPSLSLTNVLPKSGTRTVQDFSWSEGSDQLLILTKTQPDDNYELHSVTVAPAVGSPERVSNAFPLPWSELFRLGNHACYFGELGDRVCVAFDDAGTDASIVPADHTSVLQDPDLVQWTISGPFQALFDKATPFDDFVLMLLHLDGEQQTRSLNAHGIIDASMSMLAQQQLAGASNHAGLWPLSKGLNTIGSAAMPEAVLTDCGTVLAWHQQGKALACSTESRLSIALVADGASSVDERSVVSGDLSPSYSLPRTFDHNVARYLYDTVDQGVLMVDLTAEVWRAEAILGHAPSERIAFAPLSDGRTLIQSGSRLWILNPDEKRPQAISGEHHMITPPPCEDSFGLGGPYEWCGSPLVAKMFTVASDAQAVLFPSQERQLYIVDLGPNGPGTPTLASEATIDCLETRREKGRPARLATGCEQELKWAR